MFTGASTGASFEGHIDELIFECDKWNGQYLDGENLLYTLVLDNCTVHKWKHGVWMENWTECGHDIVFLPPYCPQLNPIEQVQGVVKCHLQVCTAEYLEDPVTTISTAYEQVWTLPFIDHMLHLV